VTVEQVPHLFTAMQYLWLNDRSIRGVEDRTYGAWGRALDGFSLDEATDACEALFKTQDRAPTIAQLLAELRATRHRNDPTPMLTPRAEPELPREKFLHESQRRADDYREGLIRQKIKLARGPNGDCTVTPEQIAEFRAWAYEVGPIEAGWLASQGVAAEVTQPQREAGNLATTIAREGSGAAGGTAPSDVAAPRGPIHNNTADPLVAAMVAAGGEVDSYYGVDLDTLGERAAEEWAQAWLSAERGAEREAVAVAIRALDDEMRASVRELVQQQREGNPV
jgi:hypothetical protein